MKKFSFQTIALLSLTSVLFFSSCSQERLGLSIKKYPNSYYVKVKSHGKQESKTVAFTKPLKRSKDVTSVPTRSVNYLTGFSSGDNVAYPLSAPIAMYAKSISVTHNSTITVNSFLSSIKLSSEENHNTMAFSNSRVSVQQQNAAAPPSGGGKSQLVALLLCIFLGGLGIHRFYLGYIGIGIIQLLTAGGCGIWALIDLIRIITGDLKPKDDDYGKKL